LLTGYCRRLPVADWARLDAIADDRACVQGYDALARSVDQGIAIPCLYHDFAARGSAEDDPRGYWSGPRMIGNALTALGLKLPLFDYALLLYLRARGQLTAERIKALFPAEEADFVGKLLDLTSQSTIPGLAVAVLGLFGKHLQADFALWRNRLKLDESRLQDLQTMAATDQGARLGDALPRLLGESIDAAMQLPGAPPRLVLLFDTQESFWGTGRHTESAATYFERDEWLRALLAQFYRPNHGVIVALAGREPPRWADALDCPIPRELDLIDTQLIGHLDPPDADDYLTRALSHEPGRERAGDPDRALRTALIRYTQIAPDQVHPLYLGLAADLCLRARERGERLTAAGFPAGADGTMLDLGGKLVARLLSWCTGEVQSAVTALAAARGFDRALYFELGDRLRFDSSSTDFATLTSFSFVWRDPTRPDRFRIHDLLRRLIGGLEPERSQEAHAALEAIYRGRGDGELESVAEAIYHANRQDWVRGWKEWMEVMDEALDNARFALGDALAGLRMVLRIQRPYAEGAVAWRIGALESVRSRHGAAETAFSDALESLDKSLAQAPDDVATHNEKGIVLSRFGEVRAVLSDYAGAETAYLRSIAACDDALRRAHHQVDPHMNKGIALKKLGELRAVLSDYAGAESSYTQAIAAYSEAMALAPDYVKVYNNKGNALARLGELRAALSDHAGAESAYRQAVTTYDDALTRDSDFVAAYNNKGSVFGKIGELCNALSDHAEAECAYTQAIAAYGEALTRAPDNVAALINKGGVLVRHGQLRATLSEIGRAEVSFTEAVAAFSDALAQAPDNIYAHMNKGTALAALGELRTTLGENARADAAYTQAISAYGQALTRAPDYVDAHLNKGVALAKVGDLHAVRENLEKAESAYIAAIAATSEALSRAPDHIWALGNQGALMLHLGYLEWRMGNESGACNQFKEAKVIYDRALVVAPNHKDIAAWSAHIDDLLRSHCPPPDPRTAE
ncbi:MAG TPA: tetratricopeptide repeat protein, partial [Lamprocystis sp. (in: g-proteobacteria)]|nr:tetratricopeptide repeat protein [Lamprocystis sp. (in: g-proteobacteria)]